jgi:hypothetical protein
MVKPDSQNEIRAIVEDHPFVEQGALYAILAGRQNGISSGQ